MICKDCNNMDFGKHGQGFVCTVKDNILVNYLEERECALFKDHSTICFCCGKDIEEKNIVRHDIGGVYCSDCMYGNEAELEKNDFFK